MDEILFTDKNNSSISKTGGCKNLPADDNQVKAAGKRCFTTIQDVNDIIPRLRFISEIRQKE